MSKAINLVEIVTNMKVLDHFVIFTAATVLWLALLYYAYIFQHKEINPNSTKHNSDEFEGMKAESGPKSDN